MGECRIAEKLTELRNAKGVTQEEVALKLSISNKTISKWENGASMPDIPMLIELSKYYGVSTDVLIGLADDKTKCLNETIRDEFEGLDRNTSILKAFEVIKSIIPAIYFNMVNTENSDLTVCPETAEDSPRDNISISSFFNFVTNSEDANIAVMLLRNKSEFKWLKDKEKQERIVRFFKFLSDEDTISIMYFVHSNNCSANFTIDYISKNTGVSEEKVAQILDELCEIGDCSSVVANLTSGEVKVYECHGDGIFLSAITLAYEKMCGKKRYGYNLNASCKMIGGK